MPESTTESAVHVLAEATVYGLGLAQTSRRARLTIEERPDEPSLVVTHELQRRAEGSGVEWREEECVVVDPVADGNRMVVEPGYSEFPDERIVCEWNDHAQRAYVRHETRETDGWSGQTEWEVHPATGITRTATSTEQ